MVMAVAWLVMSLMLWFFVWLVKWVFMFMRDMAFEGDGLLAAHDLLMRWMLMLMLMVLVDVIGDGWMRRMLAGSRTGALCGLRDVNGLLGVCRRSAKKRNDDKQ